MKLQFLDDSYYDKIIILWNRAGLEYKPRGRDSRENIKKQIKLNPAMILGAFEDNKLVGVVFITDDGRKGWINRLAVDPQYRRKGIAKALINRAEQLFRKKGIKVFAALVESWNESSQKLFLKLNYIRSDIIYFSKRDFDYF